VASPDCGGAWRGLAGVAPGRHSGPSTRPQASALRRGGACARDRGVKGAIMPRRRPAPEGGGAAAPPSSWRLQNAQDEGISSGGFCSHCVEEVGELKSEGKAPVSKLGNGGGSAALWCGRGAAPTGAGDENLRQHKLDKPWRTQESRNKSSRAIPSPVATNSQRRRRTEAAVYGKIGAQVHVVVCFECKGVSRSSSSSLNRNSGRERRGEAERSRGGSACH
jgi:hypothetical protein